MATLNITQLKIVLAKDSTGRLKAFATKRANEVFNDAVIGMQKEFEDHLVTREIDGGLAASNISGTLGGQSAPTNLTGFIGFKEGTSSPADKIRQIIYGVQKTGGPNRGPAIKASNTELKWTFRITGPNPKVVYANTPLPWGQGSLSWAEMIETGIPGFQQFLDQFMESRVSRSGGGIQIHKGEVRQASYTKPENGYLTPIFQHFIDRIRQYAKGGLKQRFGSPQGGFLSQQGPLPPPAGTI